MTILPIAMQEGPLHGAGEAMMPAVPMRSQGTLRSLQKAGVVPHGVGIDIAYLHLAAHVCLYGGLPDDVHMSLLLYKPPSAEPEPRIYLMCASRDPASLEWVEAARAGLDHWLEAGFIDPLEDIKLQEHTGLPVYASYETLLQHNLNRLKVHGALDRYLRLKRHSVRPPVW